MTDQPLPGPAASPHKRRIRYSGRNPRRFEEKYKEHDPQRYAETVAKVAASGKTPAGTHRPIMVAEILEVLAPQPGEIAVDCTLGYGGHAQEILPRLRPGGRLLGLDADPIELPKTEARLRALGFGPEVFTTHRSNFAGLAQVLAKQIGARLCPSDQPQQDENAEGAPAVASDAPGRVGSPLHAARSQSQGGAHGVTRPTGADVILADLGVSSMQLDDPSRGFSTKFEGPLDMRMNPQRGQSASALLAKIKSEALAIHLTDNADEPDAAQLASVLAGKNFATTLELARAVRAASPGQRKVVSDLTVRRVFQALRIAVNDEFSALESFLRNLPACLNPGGRVAILTFHSGEDRRVKKAFEVGWRDGIYADIAREVIRPTPDERHANPRSSSAKLRWARRV